MYYKRDQRWLEELAIKNNWELVCHQNSENMVSYAYVTSNGRIIQFLMSEERIRISLPSSIQCSKDDKE